MMKQEIPSEETQRKQILQLLEDYSSKEKLWKLTDFMKALGYNCRAVLHKLESEKKIFYKDTGDFKTSGYGLRKIKIPKMKKGTIIRQVYDALETPMTREELGKALPDISNANLRGRLSELKTASLVEVQKKDTQTLLVRKEKKN